MARVTSTQNPLPFLELDPKRFEDLCLALVYPMLPWVDIRHYGRSGDDGGADIYAVERMETGDTRRWQIQCKRQARASARELKAIVDEMLAESGPPPAVILAIVACPVSRRAHEAFEKHARTKGVETALVWTASLVEAKLYSERQDLLFAYFGLSAVGIQRHREEALRRNLQMKRRLLKDFDSLSANAHTHEPPIPRLMSMELILHSVDDTTYPGRDGDDTEMGQWFKVEMFDFYHNGLEVIVWLTGCLANVNTGQWAPVRSDQAHQVQGLVDFNVYKTGFIPYRDIVEFDTLGDEFYTQPHLYCRFASGGLPFERYGYRRTISDARYPILLPAEKQVDYDALVASVATKREPSSLKTRRLKNAPRR